MKHLKYLGLSFIYSLACIMSDNIVSIFKMIIPTIALLIGGYYIGKKSIKKGFIEGLKLGLTFSIIIVIFNFLAFNNSFEVKYLLFYIILIISAILGSMIGINRKRA